MYQTLIKESGYEGKYVVIKNFNDSTVISDGATPQEAYEKALKEGHKHPVLIYIPPENMAQIY